MAESFTYFDDVVEYVEDILDGFDDFSQYYDCEAIANHVSEWDDGLQKFVITKEDDDFYAVVSACALA